MKPPSDQGCQYREHEGQSMCHKVCDPGETLCPFHRLMTSHNLKEEKSAVKTPRGYSE